MRVKVYFNLHKNLFSIVALEGQKKGRVISHTDTIDLKNCRYRVQKAGRERVIREKRKNVHAYIVGYMTNIDDDFAKDNMTKEITYNPYKSAYFVNKNDNLAVHNSDYCRLSVSNNRTKIIAC